MGAIALDDLSFAWTLFMILKFEVLSFMILTYSIPVLLSFPSLGPVLLSDVLSFSTTIYHSATSLLLHFPLSPLDRTLVSYSLFFTLYPSASAYDSGNRSMVVARVFGSRSTHRTTVASLGIPALGSRAPP